VRQEPALYWVQLEQTKIPAPGSPPCYFAAWEKRHYRRLRSNLDRYRFLTGRFLVRQGLSLIHGGCCRPEQWRFLRTRYGRPVPAPACGQGFSFSLSYSGHLVVAALARDCLVGVDIERICGHDQDISAALSGQEQQHLSRIEPGERALASLRTWTIKEAVAKLVGLGLSLDLTTFSVLPGSGSLQVLFGPDFPFSCKRLRISSSRIACDNGSYVLSLATAIGVEPRKRKKRKKGITVPPVRIPVRETVLDFDNVQIQGGSGYVDIAAGNRPGIWHSLSPRLPRGNGFCSAIKISGETGCIPPASSF